MLNLDKTTWDRVRFGDVVKNANAKATDPASEGIDRVIAMEHLDPGELAVRRWGSLESGTTFTRRVRPDQTLFGKRRAYQRKVAFAEFDAICSADILTFEAIPGKLLPEILPFVVKSDPFFERAVGTSAGSLSPRTNWRDLAKFEFALPTLDQQKHIADLLWAVERHLQALKRASTSLSHASSVYFSTSIHKAKEHTTLGDCLASIVDRRGITPKKLGGDFTSEGVRVISAMNIVENCLDHSRQERFVDEALARKWMKEPLREGDILLTSEAPLGQAVLVDAELDVCTGQRLFAIRPDENVIEPRFLYELLRSTYGQNALHSRASGTTVKGIRQAELVKIDIPLPPREERETVADYMGAVAEAQEAISHEQEKARRLLSSLLSSIFGDS